MKIPELLSPAGDLKSLRYALDYGADAVYAGQPRYSLRVRNNQFDKLDNLARGIAETHRRGKKFYLAVNISPHNAKLKTFLHDLAPLRELGPDALIMADPGLIGLVRDTWPDWPIHLSVQANTLNWAAARFWQSQGISRIILSRELSLEEIAEIRQHCPDLELEVFVHGALCIAYSGRCLLSGYFNHRDANQGACTNACRWQYRVHPAREDESGQVVMPTPDRDAPREEVFLLEEAERPGEYFPAFEDRHGSYLMNSRDLRAVQHVARLAEIGVDSLKIEGRTKSFYYVARTAQIHRRALDDAAAGRPFDSALLDELENLANRGYTEGFYRRHAHADYQNYQQGASVGRQQFVGEILEREGDLYRVDVKNRFAVGDDCLLITPDGNREFVLERLFDSRGQAMEVAPGSGYLVKLPLPGEVEVKQGLLVKKIKGPHENPK